MVGCDVPSGRTRRAPILKFDRRFRVFFCQGIGPAKNRDKVAFEVCRNRVGLHSALTNDECPDLFSRPMAYEHLTSRVIAVSFPKDLRSAKALSYTLHAYVKQVLFSND